MGLNRKICSHLIFKIYRDLSIFGKSMSQINRHKIILASQRGVGLSRARIACEKNQVDKRKAAFLDGERKDGFSIELAETSRSSSLSIKTILEMGNFLSFKTV